MTDRSSSPRLCVIVLNRDHRADTLACLGSLARATYANVETLVLDNASSDGTAAAVRASFPEIAIIETGGNLGYAGGNNVGLEWAAAHGANYALILNPDTTVAADCLSQLVMVAEQHPEAAFFGPLVCHFDEPDVIQSAGGIMTPGWHYYHRGQNERNIGQFRSAEPIAWATGCALMIRVAAQASIGFLDPAFFLYNEEVDWCVRARAAGYYGLLVPTARVWHKGSRRNYEPSPYVTYFTARNHLLLLKKHGAGAQALLAALASDIRTLASWSVRPRWRNKRAHRDALARAVMDFCRGRFGPRPI